MVQNRLRLPRTDGSLKRAMRRRRLDLVTLKKELINDILHFAQPFHIDVISEDFGEWGESLEEILHGCSLKELVRIHKWMGLSTDDVYEKVVQVHEMKK